MTNVITNFVTNVVSVTNTVNTTMHITGNDIGLWLFLVCGTIIAIVFIKGLMS